MNDDEMDEMLIHGVRDYNQPGPTPRDEMWKRIAEARRATSGGQPRLRVWVWPSVGIAAALILSVGIVIGRRMDHTSPATPAVQPSVAVTPVVVKPESLLNEIHRETKKTAQRAQELASADTRQDNGERSLAYRLVVLRHLAGSEAMITSFRNGARRGEIDAQMAQWSRELLSTTRLLEASQGTSDVMMTRLLGDLDLVISQIVQYTSKGTVNTDELDLIEKSINRRGVMTELRSTIPADIRRGT